MINDILNYINYNIVAMTGTEEEGLIRFLVDKGHVEENIYERYKNTIMETRKRMKERGLLK